MEIIAKIKRRLQKYFNYFVKLILFQYFYIPRPIMDNKLLDDSTFMQYSTCSAIDFSHPKFFEICKLMDIVPRYHRKIWEHVFIFYHLQKMGLITDGMCGLGFGVGLEPLPAVFAKYGVDIVATDAPLDIAKRKGWIKTDQFSKTTRELFNPKIIDQKTFDKKIKLCTSDMNNISDEFRNFDFTWSACAFEHLGSIDKGLEFVINSVEKTLKPGGVACHTTELNLSSNDKTLETGGTVLFRKKDIEALITVLSEKGHRVMLFTIAPDAHFFDFFVDVAPYSPEPHLKLKVANYVVTSVGLIIQKAA